MRRERHHAFLRTTLAVAACVFLPAGPARAQEEEQRPPSYRDIPAEDEQYRFLRLGESKDYLETERKRIVDQIEQAIPPLYEPVRPFHGYTLPPGAWRVALSTSFTRNPGDFGTDDDYALFFNKVEVDTLAADLSLQYGFELGPVKDLTLDLSVPFKMQRTTGTGHPFRIKPMEMTMEGSARGLGDVSLTLKKKWFDQGNLPFTFSTMLGAIFPTADDDEEFNNSQTIFINGVPVMPVSGNVAGNPSIDVFSRNFGERLFPRKGQPGNGSWGARFGVGLTRQFDRSALHGGAIFDLLAKNDGITPGHELKYGISYVFPPTPSDQFSIDLSLFGLWKGNEKFPGLITHPIRDVATGGPVMDAAGNMLLFTTKRPDFKHGNATFASPSLIFIPSPNTRIFISPAYRIIEPRRGPSPEWMITAGITFTF
ncbi:MAG: transporter [Planctomycetes bacterium]|nr:transporter [Planctomycetota bacterium]